MFETYLPVIGIVIVIAIVLALLMVFKRQSTLTSETEETINTLKQQNSQLVKQFENVRSSLNHQYNQRKELYDHFKKVAAVEEESESESEEESEVEEEVQEKIQEIEEIQDLPRVEEPKPKRRYTKKSKPEASTLEL